jgi:hypothetical protein
MTSRSKVVKIEIQNGKYTIVFNSEFIQRITREKDGSSIRLSVDCRDEVYRGGGYYSYTDANCIGEEPANILWDFWINQPHVITVESTEGELIAINSKMIACCSVSERRGSSWGRDYIDYVLDIGFSGKPYLEIRVSEKERDLFFSRYFESGVLDIGVAVSHRDTHPEEYENED